MGADAMALPAEPRRLSGVENVLRIRSSRGLLMMATASALVVGVHFRPWQGGLLEDWELANAWQSDGLSGFTALIPQMAARPLHLVPHYLGLALSGGGFVGLYAVLATVAVLQLIGTWWALDGVVGRWALRGALALAVALHPWWPAGDILRFLSAQVAVLGTVLWLGGAVRYLSSGRRRWLVLAVLAPAVGLLTYQAPALALCVGVVALAWVRPARWARRLALIAATVATVSAVLVWSVVVAPRLSPESYESGLIGSGFRLGDSVVAIARTLVRAAPSLVVAGALLAVLVVVLLGRQVIDTGQALVLLAAIAGAPLSGLIYASMGLHLNDPERVALPVGLTLWLVAVSVASCLSAARSGWTSAFAAGAVVATVFGAAAGYATWTGYAAEQQRLLRAIEPVRESLPARSTLVVEDLSGTYGDVYTFLPPHLDIALDVVDGPGADVSLCTPASVPRHHPVADRYPIETTPLCDDLVNGAPTRDAGTVTADGLSLRLLVIDGVPPVS